MGNTVDFFMTLILQICTIHAVLDTTIKKNPLLISTLKWNVSDRVVVKHSTTINSVGLKRYHDTLSC